MKDEIRQRIQAVQRFLAGEKPETICVSMGLSRSWLYKWISRYDEKNSSWSENRPTVLFHATNRTPLEIEEIVKMIRLNLYNQNLFCGAQAILWELEDLGVKPLPSLRTINRILNRNELTHRRTGKYEPKGTPYPKLPALLPNQTHQMDLVGPCYLTGPLRFYGINVIDAATARCGLHASPSKAGQDVLDGAWAIWSRLGIPDNLQIDNDVVAVERVADQAGHRGLVRVERGGDFRRLALTASGGGRFHVGRPDAAHDNQKQGGKTGSD